MIRESMGSHKGEGSSISPPEADQRKGLKVLTVCGGNRPLAFGSFVKEQVESLQRVGVEEDVFLIEGRGIHGYARNLPALWKRLSTTKYDLIHAHYGLAGLFAGLQWSVPVITTFHGSDLHKFVHWILSLFAHFRSSLSIVVNAGLVWRLPFKSRTRVIPCGVNLAKFYPMDKKACRARLGLDQEARLVLFSSAFVNRVKNAPLAKEATAKLKDVTLVELNGYDVDGVRAVLNACDALLVTSFRETGPAVVKEALACNRPVVSTPVGDMVEVLRKIEGCFVCDFDAVDVAAKLELAMQFETVAGREHLGPLTVESVAERINAAYAEVKLQNSRFR